MGPQESLALLGQARTDSKEHREMLPLGLLPANPQPGSGGLGSLDTSHLPPRGLCLLRGPSAHTSGHLCKHLQSSGSSTEP